VIQSKSLDAVEVSSPRVLTSAEIHASRARIFEAADEVEGAWSVIVTTEHNSASSLLR
jgi:hypothetical protein